MSDKPSDTPHKRRVRYRGTHPRKFSEKYKEHDPERYKDDVAHVISRGDTPAGTHRSVCLNEVLEFLDPKPGEIAVDATLGYGGHSREIIKRILPDGLLLGFDVDPVELRKTEARIRAEGIGPESFVAINASFSTLYRTLSDAGQPMVDMILADLGISSMQIDNPQRGFSYKNTGPLDMRMNQDSGESAAQLLQRLSEEEIAAILSANGDEPDADIIARAILQDRKTMLSTKDLSRAIRRALTKLKRDDKEITKATRRVFQAIRIAVNEELSALDALLLDIPRCLKPGGRVVVLTFHSGEDKRVVASFEEGLRSGLYSRMHEEDIRESREERYGNPRSRSVRLRWAIKA
ncbi:MAG: 16S rRNA (cytosine(1402)-N(4))-methyltransferase RsmH [Spirochaetia bacterium]|jgi:16S rRNA (cytosine1402-N4)-methyltransferase|nr:16S rRNA (cytosine(1402)-N(4))-methyltransferase RsmH [Spirochaetia bacterium]